MTTRSKRMQALVQRINATSNADFVKRLLDEKRKTIPAEDGKVMTHRLGYVEEDGHAVVFPDVQSDGDSLRLFHYPESYERAVQNGDTVHMSPRDARIFTKNYKKYYPSFNKYDGRDHAPRETVKALNTIKARGGLIERYGADAIRKALQNRSQEENNTYGFGSWLTKRRADKRFRAAQEADEETNQQENTQQQEGSAEDIYFDGTLQPAIIEDKLPEKFHGSQAAARRYAEAYKFGKDIIQKRDKEFEQYAPVVFGAPIAVGLGAAAAAPALYAASYMTPIELSREIGKGLSYLQPSKYIDWASRGFKMPSLLRGAQPFYSGATTTAGAIADTLMDSYFVSEGVKNAGKTGSVAGEITNSLNFLPAIAPALGAVQYAQRVWPEYRNWANMVIGGDMSALESARGKAMKLMNNHTDFQNNWTKLLNRQENPVTISAPIHIETRTFPYAEQSAVPKVNGTVSNSPFRYVTDNGAVNENIPYVSVDLGVPGAKQVVIEQEKFGLDPGGNIQNYLALHVPESSIYKTHKSLNDGAYRFSSALRERQPLPYAMSMDPVENMVVNSSTAKPLGYRSFLETDSSGSTLNVLAPQASEASKPIREYLEGMTASLGTDGVVAGSTTLHAHGYLSGTPHDTEIITTSSKLPYVEQKIGFTQTGGNDIALSGTAKGGFNTGDTDIQIIQESENGEATGRLAWSLFRTMHPAEYQRQAQASVLHEINYTDQAILNPKTGVPYTADELLEEFQAGGYSLKNTLVDALSVVKDQRHINIHKHNRPISLLTDTRPGSAEAISDAIETVGVSQIGTGFKKGSEWFQNLRFDDVKQNEEFLKMLGIESKEVAENPEVMKNLFDYWYMQQSIQKRGIYGAEKDMGRARRWSLESNYQRGDGDASGAGRNTVMATTSHMPFSHPYVGTSQTHLTSQERAAGITSINDVVKKAERLKNTAKLSHIEIKDASKVFNAEYENLLKNPEIKGSVDRFFSNSFMSNEPTVEDFQEGIRQLARSLKDDGISDTEVESVIDGLANAFDIPFFRNMGSWYEQKYIGVLRKNSDAGGVRFFDFANAPNMEVRPYEYGRAVEDYAVRGGGSSSSVRLSPDEAQPYLQPGEYEAVQQFRERIMPGAKNPMTIGELQKMNADIKVEDRRGEIRDMMYEWLDNTHEFEDTINRLEKLESMPGVKLREEVNTALENARRARIDRRITRENEEVASMAVKGTGSSRRKAIAKKYFNKAGKEADLSAKFKDYNLVSYNSDGSGFYLADKTTGDVARVTRSSSDPNKWVAVKDTSLPKFSSISAKINNTRLRMYRRILSDALKNDPSRVPGSFNLGTVKDIRKISDSEIRVYSPNGGYDTLIKENGRWVFDTDLPFAYGGTLLHPYSYGGNIQTNQINRNDELMNKLSSVYGNDKTAMLEAIRKAKAKNTV